MVESIYGDVAYNVENDLRLDASRNTSTYEDGMESESASVGFGNNGVSFGYNQAKSSSDSKNTYYTNSGTYASEGDIIYNVAGDMTGAGYNAEGKKIAVNVGGDMILNSLQDTGDAKNSSSSFGVGVGMDFADHNNSATTTSSKSGNASYGQSHGSGSYAQTVVSSIVGTESVDIDVDGKLSMSGSTIANLDREGNDLGNLDINVGSFESENLRNFSENEQSGFNISTNVSQTTYGNDYNNDRIVDEEFDVNNGSTTIGVTNKSHETKGETYATIGEGTITTADNSDISDLNRDTDNIQETTSDKVTGALDGSVTVDHRVFTPDGWSKTIVRQKVEGDEAVYRDTGEQGYSPDNTADFETVDVGIIADFKDAGKGIAALDPIAGVERIFEDLGIVPHLKRVEGQELGEWKSEPILDEKGEPILGADGMPTENRYYLVEPEKYISIYGKEITEQEGFFKYVTPHVNDNGEMEYRLYVNKGDSVTEMNNKMDASFRDTGGFGKWSNDSLLLYAMFPGMTGTSQYHDVQMQRKERLRDNNPFYYDSEKRVQNSNIGLGTLIDTGIATWFKNRYYSSGTYYKMLQGDEAFREQYKTQTESNVRIKE